MASIAMMNNIFRDRGPEAAVAYARAGCESWAAWVIGKIQGGTWDPDSRSKDSKAQHVVGVSIPCRRESKTTRNGGVEASRKRKSLKRNKSRELRAHMQGSK